MFPARDARFGPAPPPSPLGPAPMTRRASTWKLRAAALLAGGLAPLVFAELALRLLPVQESRPTLPVDDRNPIARLEPDREFTWSRGWDFAVVNTVRVNNAGFVSDVDYEPDAPGPLLTVIGDSFVEALMVPFRQTCAGRLATMLEPGGRVYAFGLGGAALGQYLAWARYARDAFGPAGLVVIVINNDYDGSLLEYSRAAKRGYHHFVERGGGRLALRRLDTPPPAPAPAFRLALGPGQVSGIPYRGGVAGAGGAQDPILDHGTPPPPRVAGPAPLAGERDAARVSASKRAIDAFLDLLPHYSGLDPERIVFVVDGIRRELYDDERLEEARGSFLDVMRRYFLANAGRKGYETIDLQPRFIAHYREHGQRFEWPRDRHWNALGHERCFEAVASSKMLATVFPAP